MRLSPAVGPTARVPPRAGARPVRRPTGPGSGSASRATSRAAPGIPSSSSSPASAAARSGAASRRARLTVAARSPASCFEGGNLGRELGEPVVGSGQAREALARPSEEPQHVGIGLTVLAAQRLQRLHAFSHLLQPGWVGGERLPVVADVARELGGLGRERACPLGEPCRRRIHRGGGFCGARRRRRARRRHPRRPRAPSRRSPPRRSSARRATAAPPRPPAHRSRRAAGRSPRSPAPGTRGGRARVRGRGRPR